MIQIFVENLEVVARHGVYADERAHGRRFRFDVEARLADWPISDQLRDTLDYRRLASIIVDVAAGQSVRLIETLGWCIADRAFREHTDLVSLNLRIRKQATHIDGNPEWVGAAFELDRAGWERQREKT